SRAGSTFSATCDGRMLNVPVFPASSPSLVSSGNVSSTFFSSPARIPTSASPSPVMPSSLPASMCAFRAKLSVRSPTFASMSTMRSSAASSQRCSRPYVRSYIARGALPGRKPGILACCTCRANTTSAARARRSASTSTSSVAREPGSRRTVCRTEGGAVVGGFCMESSPKSMGYARPPQVFFYEIHEGDEDLGAAVLVAHEERFEPLEFFALVKKARALLVGSYEEDSLAEAIANELARANGFIHVTD